MDLKQVAISISMMVFVLSSMLGMGLGLRVSEIVAPLRNWRLVTLSLVANFVVMPIAALALARILRLELRGSQRRGNGGCRRDRRAGDPHAVVPRARAARAGGSADRLRWRPTMSQTHDTQREASAAAG